MNSFVRIAGFRRLTQRATTMLFLMGDNCVCAVGIAVENGRNHPAPIVHFPADGELVWIGFCIHP